MGTLIVTIHAHPYNRHSPLQPAPTPTTGTHPYNRHSPLQPALAPATGAAGVLVWGVIVATTSPDGSGGWLTKDLNEGRLDLFYLLMAVLMAGGLLLFLFVAARYQYKAVEHVRVVQPQRSSAGGRRPLPVNILGRPVSI